MHRFPMEELHKQYHCTAVADGQVGSRHCLAVIVAVHQVAGESRAAGDDHQTAVQGALYESALAQQVGKGYSESIFDIRWSAFESWLVVFAAAGSGLAIVSVVLGYLESL